MAWEPVDKVPYIGTKSLRRTLTPQFYKFKRIYQCPYAHLYFHYLADKSAIASSAGFYTGPVILLTNILLTKTFLLPLCVPIGMTLQYIPDVFYCIGYISPFVNLYSGVSASLANSIYVLEYYSIITS